jgi:hypothetical protein
MPRRRNPVPTYRLHKQSGQAIVTLTGGLGRRRDVMLGRHGSPESRAEYARVLVDWEAGGQRLPERRGAPGRRRLYRQRVNPGLLATRGAALPQRCGVPVTVRFTDAPAEAAGR